MVTMVGLESNFKALVHDLIELDYDAIRAYEAAVERLEDESFKEKMREFLMDHRRHVEELSTLLQGLGEEIPDGPDSKQYLTKGKVIIADLFGDKVILMAMKTNEEDTNTAYERALEHEDLPEYARDTIARGLADERRHRAWLEQTIQAL